MTNVNVTMVNLVPLAGASTNGLKMAFIDSAGKAAQNDTWTVGGASEVVCAMVTLDSSGAYDPCTISTNVITLTGAGTGASSGIIIYR
jgi:hypothetical protein